MTSHELAALLLSGPDLPVVFSVYTGGNDEMHEVESVQEYQTEFMCSPQLELLTYRLAC